MKQLLFAFFSLITFSVAAQDCPGYYYLLDNATIELTSFDRKDRPQGKIIYKVTNVSKSSDGITSTLTSEIYDDKGEMVAGSSGTFRCSGDNLYMNMKMAIPNGAMGQFKNMEIKASDVYLEYPANMSVGQTLEEGAYHMEMLNNGNHFADMDYEVSNRKVVAKETITSDAGTWDCYKITYDGDMAIDMGLSIHTRIKGADWFAPGFGIVKSENYNKNGKLRGYTLLTRFEK